MFELNQLTIQTFDDNKERSRNDLAQIFPYNRERIDQLSAEGAGVFFPPNPQIDPHKRSIDNTSHLKAVSLDLDVTKEGQGLVIEEINKKKQEFLETIKSLEIIPNYVIETKHGLQPIWEFEKPYYLDTPDKRNRANGFYRRLVAGITVKTGLKSEGDSLCRVIRLPNSLHQKDPNNPFKVIISKLSEFKPSLKEFIEIYPPVAAKEFRKPLSAIVNGSSEGSRNIDAASLIGSLLTKYPPDDWESICLPLLQAWNDDRNSNPLPDKELRSVFNSIARNELQRRTQNVIPPVNSLGLSVAETNSDPILPKIQTWEVFVNEPMEGQDWIIDDLLRPGWLAVLGGHGKQGKSTLAVHLLNALSQGKQFINNTLTVPAVYINCEMSQWDMQELIKTVSADSLLRENAKIINDVRAPLNFEWLESCLAQEELPGVCVIDSFRGAFMLSGDSENQAGAVGGILRQLQAIARRTNWAIIVIHHFRKSGKGEALDLAGSGEWLSAPDVIYTWSCPKPNEPGTLIITGRVPPSEPLSIKLSREKIEFLGTVTQQTIESERQKVLEVLTEAPQTSTEITKIVELPGSTVRKRLEELFQNNKAGRVGEGKKGNPYLWQLNESEE